MTPDLIRRAIQTHGTKTAAAAHLGLPRKTMMGMLDRGTLSELRETEQGASGQNVVVKPKRHLIIPDTQVKPGVPLEHMSWIGAYAAEKNPDVIVCLGDFADMPSLSSYDKGKKQFEGRRYKADIEAVHSAMEMLMTPLVSAGYKGRLVLTLGNHENRINRATEDDPKLDGTLSVDDLGYEAWGWEVVPFLHVVEIDQISYSHYFYNPMSGRPYAGTCITKLKNIGMSFVMGHQQGIDIAMRDLANGKKQHGLVAGSCLTPDHKVLTADLRYIPLGDVVVGDKLVSFDESLGETALRGRRYKTGEVLATKVVDAEVYAVALSDGKVVKATADHLWLIKVGSMYQWRTTLSLRKGTRVPKVMPEWEELKDWDAGYLTGIYDGEGCYYTRETSAGVVGQLTLTQKPGAVLSKCIGLLENVVGVGHISHTNNRGVTDLRIQGGTRNIAKVLGQLRPVRLLSKFVPELLGGMRSVSSENAAVTSVDYLGVMPVVHIDIDVKTMVVEGMPHHNCYQHDEEYKGPQGNGHYQGIVVLNEVKDGGYDLMQVSLDYLRRKYSGESNA